MADLSTLNTRLSEAEAALHALAMGERVVEVWRDGRRVTFAQANRSDLVIYAEQLKLAIEAASATETTRPRRRFIPVSFG